MYVVDAYGPLMVLIGNVPTVQVDVYLIFLGAFSLVFVFTLYVSPCTSLHDGETGHVADEKMKCFHRASYQASAHYADMVRMHVGYIFLADGARWVLMTSLS